MCGVDQGCGSQWKLCLLTNILTHSLPHSLTVIHSLTQSHTHTHSFTQSHSQSVIHTLSHAHCHSLLAEPIPDGCRERAPYLDDVPWECSALSPFKFCISWPLRFKTSHGFFQLLELLGSELEPWKLRLARLGHLFSNGQLNKSYRTLRRGTKQPRDSPGPSPGPWHEVLAWLEGERGVYGRAVPVKVWSLTVTGSAPVSPRRWSDEPSGLCGNFLGDKPLLWLALSPSLFLLLTWDSGR